MYIHDTLYSNTHSHKNSGLILRTVKKSSGVYRFQRYTDIMNLICKKLTIFTKKKTYLRLLQTAVNGNNMDNRNLRVLI